MNVQTRLTSHKLFPSFPIFSETNMPFPSLKMPFVYNPYLFSYLQITTTDHAFIKNLFILPVYK